MRCFQPTTGTSAAILRSKGFGESQRTVEWRAEKHRNYASIYAESGELAKIEVDRIEQMGYIQTFADWPAVLQRWPAARASKVALLVKDKPHGTRKSRLIIDLLRSGINGEVENPERVVLPRVSDLTESVLDLQALSPQTGVELATLDFEDAFHTLSLREEDRANMVFKTGSGWAAFSRLCCGMASAPLIWARVAAAGCRLGQAMFRPSELRLQCFVDDPAMAVRGAPGVRAKLLGIMLRSRHLLGSRHAFKNGSSDPHIFRIGVHSPICPPPPSARCPPLSRRLP